MVALHLARSASSGLLLAACCLFAPAAALGADCDVVRGNVRVKALSLISSYPGPAQDFYVLEVHASLASNVRTDLQGPTPPIEESDRPHYCSAFNWWAKKLFVATEGRYRMQRAHFWEIDADEDRGDWKAYENPFHVHWLLGHAFEKTFWPSVDLHKDASIVMSDFPIMCNGNRFVNVDGTFADAVYACDAGIFDVLGSFDCAIHNGGGFCVDGNDLVAPSARYHGSILHHEGGHFLLGLPDEIDRATGKLGCFSEFEQSASASCGGDAVVGEWGYGDETVDGIGGVTSVMSSGYRDHFCDPTTHLHEIHHDFTNAGGGVAITHNENLDINMDSELNASMWEIIREFSPGLDNDVHTDGEFGTFEYDDLPDIDCVFHEDVLRNDPLIVLDRSFSMNFSSPPDPDYTALDGAKEAAANLYNLVPDGIYAGVTAYNVAVSVPVPYAPVDFDAPQDGKITVEDHLVFGPNNNTNVIAAITESTQIIVDAQQENPGQLSGSMILLSDGVPTDPPDLTPEEQREQILLASLEACAAGDPPIAIHTIAFGAADTELLHDIASACNGMMKVNGGNRAAEETPLDYKESLARMGYDARGRAEVLHERQVLVSATQEFPFFVAGQSADLEFTWLGKPHSFKPGSAPNAPPLAECEFDELDFELETPSGVIVPAAVASPVGALELGYGVRTARQGEPEAGFWTARVRAPMNCIATMPELVWLGNVRNGWYDTTLHLSDEVAPRNTPVSVEATVYYAAAPLTNVFILLQVLNKGQSQLLLPGDDGNGPDARAGDGVYTAEIPALPGGQEPGGITVRALYVSLEGLSTPVPEPLDPFAEGVDINATGVPALPGTALFLDEETLVRRDCCVLPADSTVGCARTCPIGANLDQSAPKLLRGQSQSGVEVQVCGLPLLPRRVQAGAGPGVVIQNLRSTYDPETECGILTFDAAVRADSEIGPRRISVESNGRLLRADGGLIVCNEDGPLAIDPEDVIVHTCAPLARVELPVPDVTSACSDDDDIALTAELRRIGGRPLLRPRRIDPDAPAVNLPPGPSEIVWRAEDGSSGEVVEATQVVTVVARDPGSCCDLDNDEDVDRRDIEILVRAAGTEVEPGSTGDVTGDGEVSIADALVCFSRCTSLLCREQR